MILFKPRVGKVIFTQTTGGFSVIIPKNYFAVVCVAVVSAFFGWSHDTVYGSTKTQKRVNSNK